MDTETTQWILLIKKKAQALREASETLDEDVRESSFDIQDAMAIFKDIKKIVEELAGLLEEEE